MAEEAEPPKSKRLFVNCVDLYQGGNLGRFLSNCVVGASLEEGEEEEEDGRSVSSMPVQKEGCYEIIGTLKFKDSKKPDFVKEIIQYENKEQLYEHLYECDVIVYDITEDPDQIDEATWAVSELHSDLEKMDSGIVFILISSALTWARSKPLDPDDPEIPFTEEDYRRRKPHPSYKDHISAEKTVIKLGKTNKNKLTTYVVNSGLTYGCGENIFHFLFKAAWHNAPQLQCFGNGQNVLPTIHIKDLAGVIQNIADAKPKTRYLVAVDDSQNTLEEIVKAISQNLGTGQIKMVSKEEALLLKDVRQSDFDQLLANLRMDAVFVKETMRINWVAEAGIVENIQQIVREYRMSRSLLPLRACILGPPGVGKTTVIKQLCEFYKLHHVKMADVIEETIERLEKSAARVDAEEEEEDDGRAAEDQELLESVLQSKEENNGRIEDQYIVRFYREKLKSMPCQNQGFIIDGYPKLLEQAKDLFLSEEDDEEETRGGGYDKAIMPDNIIVLDADDEFLRSRIMNLPETEVHGTHNTEPGLTRRLEEYRNANNEDDTVLNYFDELEFHPEHIDITKDKSPMMADTVERIKKLMGKARNYGPTEEELEEIRRQDEEEKKQKEAMEAQLRAQREADEAKERARRQEEWADRLAIVKREEFELLETQSIPLRNYLMKHVMPTLTQGLVDCCKVRPDDAVDYLAEYLFKANPQVD